MILEIGKILLIVAAILTGVAAISNAQKKRFKVAVLQALAAVLWTLPVIVL